MRSVFSCPIGAVLFLVSCSTLDTTHVVELYDIGRPDGVLEMELERDGSIRELEVEVPIDMLPVDMRRIALERLPGAEVIGAEREFKGAGRGWEVKLRSQGKVWEFVFDDAGEILEIEQELDRSAAPEVVLSAAERAIPGGTFRSVERIQRGSVQEYHVKLQLHNASYKVVLAADGGVLRKVREHRAEVEIPLAR